MSRRRPPGFRTGGFLDISQTAGTGVFVRHHPGTDADSVDTWGPPLAIELVSVGAGLFAGVEQNDICTFFVGKGCDNYAPARKRCFYPAGSPSNVDSGPRKNTKKKVNAYLSGKGITSTVSFVRKMGGFVGVSLDGGLLRSRSLINSTFYADGYSTAGFLNSTSSGKNDEVAIQLPQSARLASLMARLQELSK